jgi:nicotinate phosphoribosyltransferase
MQQALFLCNYSAVPVEYLFACRTPGIDFSECYQRICENIDSLKDISMTKDEYTYLKSLPYITNTYLTFLKDFRFDPNLIDLTLLKNGGLDLRIRGDWFHTILFEVPVLSIISQCFAEQFDLDGMEEKVAILTSVKDLNIELPEDFRFADFGTRRRFNKYVQEQIILYCIKQHSKQFVGTSNMSLAMLFDVKPIGTMAHEWLMAHQQLGYRLADSQRAAFDNWVKVYRGRLGIALADVINTSTFIKDFDDLYFLKLFDGVREDSEPDPIAFGHKIANMYFYNKINPKTKTVVFSNGLDIPKALKIYEQMQNIIGSSYGIGTKLTNNTPHALNIVIKMVKCNGQPVAKLSNEPAKCMCEDQSYINYLKSVFKVT